MNVHLTLQSRNSKTGPIPVSTTSAETCPNSCPFKASGCYASAGGPLSMHWRAVNEGKRGGTWADFLTQIAKLPLGQLWRHNQAGDLPGQGNKLDVKALMELARANIGRRGFTYTHKTLKANWPTIRKANAEGFTINLSANSPAHADKLSASGLPIVTVLPSSVDGAKTRTLTTPAGRTIAVCPATYNDSVTCASCQLCQRQNRKVIVGFPAHGAQAGTIDKRLSA